MLTTRIDHTQFGIERNYRDNGYNIYGIVKTPGMDRRFISGVTIETEILPEIPDATYHYPPIIISEDSAQNLMDELWQAGVRPSGGEGHTAHIRALNSHLEDMRKIVFDKLEIE